MNAKQLKELVTSGPGAPLLLNVLPEEVHAAQRISGSANACVYETAFLEKVAALAPAKDRPLVVYGSGRFFRYLGKHVVNDHLHVKVHAGRVAGC